MTITSFDKKMFKQAYIEATKSTFDRFHVGAVIAYKGHIIGRGHNSTKTHPMQQEYDMKYRMFNNYKTGDFIRHSIHAEIACLNSVPYTVGRDVDWSKAKIYVYRICTGKRLGYGCSRPCPACTHAIRDLGIRHVYFTDDNGLSYLELQ